jgi:hypothetical protein
LKAENGRLRVKLRLMEREALKYDDDETIYVPPPPVDPNYRADSRDLESRHPSPAMTKDRRGARFPDEESTPPPQARTLRRNHSAGLTGLHRGHHLPPPPLWKRDESVGLMNLQPRTCTDE